MKRLPNLRGVRLILLAVGMLVFSSGCSYPALTGSSYSRAEARQVQQVQYATVVSVNPVVIEGRSDGIAGTGAGAIVGGLAGSRVGGGTGQKIAGVLGAVVGGIAGQAIEEKTTRRQGQEITLRLSNGETIAVVQEVDNQRFFRPGEQVRLLRRGGVVRVTY